MYRIHHNGQLSIEEFHVPFSGTLDSDNRWMLNSSLIHGKCWKEQALLSSTPRLAPLRSQ